MFEVEWCGKKEGASGGDDDNEPGHGVGSLNVHPHGEVDGSFRECVS